MVSIGSLLFGESVDARNRYALVACNPSIDTQWNITVNGTDRNGTSVYPLFVTIDNYSNRQAVTYSIDGVSGGVAAYTKVVLAISPVSRSFQLTVNVGTVNVYFSEKRLPISDGQKFQVDATNFTSILTIANNGAPWVVPLNWNNNANVIHVIGGGGNGLNSVGPGLAGRGGGGAAYARNDNNVFVPGASINFTVGNTTSDTNFNGAGFLMAKGANAVTNIGGQASASVGQVKTSGGNGGDGSGVAQTGGGGAGGPNSGGSNQNNAAGGAGDGGVQGGVGGIASGGVGGNGAIWQRNDGTFFGPGGGGAGGNTGIPGGVGGNYGAGGGGGFDGSIGAVGTPGLIVIQWAP